jgi:hypothetical protein
MLVALEPRELGHEILAQVRLQRLEDTMVVSETTLRKFLNTL